MDGAHRSEGMLQMPLIPPLGAFTKKMTGEAQYVWWMGFNQVKRSAWSTLRFNHAAKETDFKAIYQVRRQRICLPAYKLPLIAGRNLQPSDMTREFLVNESLVKSLGMQKS